MKIGVFSDIHSNQEALEAVFEDMEKQNITLRICLGDIVGYGACPNECIELVKSFSSLTIMGNHDIAAVGRISIAHFNAYAHSAIIWTRKILLDSSKTYLDSLPMTQERHGALFVHATPHEPDAWHYLNNMEQAAENFGFFIAQFCFVGHTHIPYIISNSDKETDPASRNHIKGEPGTRYLVNVGSVGQPRDRDVRACYTVYDPEKPFVEFRRVNYNIQKAQDRMKKENLPDFLIKRLAQGR